MEEEDSLTIQEHDWLKAIYDCVIDGDCTLYNMIQNVTETTAKIWNQYKRTDQSIVTGEAVTSSVVNDTSNLTIAYNVSIPKKEGYGVVEGIQGYDDFLPIKLSYWFLDETNTTCYNQGNKSTGVEGPYCNALTVTTVGQIEMSIDFTVDIRPELPAGNYTIVRSIEIDPENVWIDYGQERIGKVEVLSLGERLVSLRYEELDEEDMVELEETHEETETQSIGETPEISIDHVPTRETKSPTGLFAWFTQTNITLATSLITLFLVCYMFFVKKR